MKITITGPIGSGKSSVAKELAKRLNLKFYSIGALRRNMAMERGMTIHEFNELGEKEGFTDREVDNYQKEIGKKKDNFVIDGKLGFYFIPDSIKIFLDVNLNIAANRLFNAKRKDESMYKNLEEAKKLMIKKLESDNKRYMKYYGIRYDDKDKFDIIIDTSNLTLRQVTNKVINFINKKKNKKLK